MKKYDIYPYNYALEDDLLIFSDTQLDLKFQDLIDIHEVNYQIELNSKEHEVMMLG